MKDATPMGFVATSNPEKAMSFYRDTLGLPMLADEDFAIVFQIKGSVLRVQKVPQHSPAQHTVFGWTVEDIRSSVTSLSESGVEFLRFPMFEQDELGIWETDGARIAWFSDPDGNVLSLTEVSGG